MSAHKDGKSNSTAALHQKLHKTGTDGDVSLDETEESTSEVPELISHESYAELQKKLNEAEEKTAQYYDRMLRMQAETDNIQRRVERDVASAHKYGLEKFALELLPVIDSMERSLEIPVDENDKAVIEGVALTLKMFQSALEKFGIEQVNPKEELFNPDLHQAVSVQMDPKVPPNTVLGVLQKGYLLNKRLIRPAFVIVSKQA